MSVKRLATGARMSQAVVAGGLVFTAGQVADEAGGTNVAGQTRNILQKIDALLAEAGTDKSKAVSVTIWLTDMAAFAEMNSVYDAWVTPGETAARACVEAKLAAPRFLVEIAVVAAL